MKTTITRLLALMLAMLMLVAMVACADDTVKDPDTKNPNEDASGDTQGDSDSNGRHDNDDAAEYQVEDSLPEITFGGESFDIMYYQDKMATFFYVPERTGDVIDDALFNALAKTEERFDVLINAFTPASASEHAYTSAISTQITAGTVEFDIANVHDVLGGNLSLQGMFLNVHDIPNLDFSKPWWSEKAIDSLSYMDQLYLISSTLSYNSMGSSSVMFFNKDMLVDYGLEAPYQKVLDMEWYMDDLLEDLAVIYTDNNGNGKDEEDFYGILLPEEFYAWYESFGINQVEKSDDGTELILNANDPRAYDLIDKLYYILHESDGGYSTKRDTMKEMFLAHQGLYLTVSLHSAVENFRNCDFIYGIVPYPMLDTVQEEYYSGYTERFMVIPNTCTDTEFVGTIIESMSAEGYRQVLPAYYETALKGRYSRDSESVQMLEIIREARVIDFAYVYGNNKCCSRALHELLKQPSKDYASYYAGLKDAGEARLEELAEIFGGWAD